VNIRLYLDEDSMQQALVNALRARGVEVITALETGMIERKDEHHLEYATERGCVLFSFNVGEIMRKLLLLISTTPAEAMVNQVEFLSSWD
jgi:methylmalonyl-CoA mutase cobalamin-binding subunit